MRPREFPEAGSHGELKQVFEDVFFVTGSVRLPIPLPTVISRNMTVVRQGESLTLINSMRLDERGLTALDALGKVEHVIRIAGFHGMDDPFYKDRYGAKVWSVQGQVYAVGFNTNATEEKAYFKPDVQMDESIELPIAGATLYRFKSCTPGEGLIVLDREGGIIVSGDSLQNSKSADRYYNLVGKVMMKLMGFIKPHNVGPEWLKQAKPDAAEIRGILDLRFDHVLPVHGMAVIGNAKEAYRPAIERIG